VPPIRARRREQSWVPPPETGFAAKLRPAQGKLSKVWTRDDDSKGLGGRSDDPIAASEELIGELTSVTEVWLYGLQMESQPLSLRDGDHGARGSSVCPFGPFGLNLLLAQPMIFRAPIRIA
jgi:hypothetical protein